MGGCCSCQLGHQKFEGFIIEDNEVEKEFEDLDVIRNGDCGARVRLQGSSKYVSMFTQQGKKGVNQDAMTVWENFAGEKDTFFCGVFDGHGPSGHKVARYIRDILPSKLSSSFKPSQVDGNNRNNDDDHKNNVERKDHYQNPFFSSWESALLKSFEEMDEELEANPTIETYGSGTTAVTIVKQGQHLMIANLGDSRAVLCTRGDNELLPIQLTVDLKPNLPCEAERIKKCKGRVLALEEEPSVFRVWMPNEDCPGLAMARAFGDFCLKDFGLVSTPEISYRKLTERDEFVVIATDGVWDVLSNKEVIRIVASAKKRSLAARLLVHYAIRAWRCKYPCAKIDDCAAICMFFKRQRPFLTKSISEVTELSLNYPGLGLHHHPTTTKTDDGLETLLDCEVTKDSNNSVDEGGIQLDPSVNIPLYGSGMNRRRPTKDFEYVES